MKQIQKDVEAVVEHLQSTLGATWAEASIPRPQKRSILANPPKAPLPWVSRDRTVAAHHEFDRWIRSHLDSKVTWM